MNSMTLTALYDARAEADQAGERLVREAGVARADVTVIAQDAPVSGGGATADGAGESTGFFGSLKNLFMPEEDRHTYSEAIGRGGFLLTARVEQDNAERATAILEEHGAVDLDERQESWRAGGWTGQQAPMAQILADGGDEKIALVQERLIVGKRAVSGGSVRVRSYVVETPVQEQVSLREETVSIERRAADRPVTGADDAAFRGRTIEATEIGQEVVVAKTARVTEELVVRTGVEERVETVRDTVRHTEVEVDEDRTAARGAAETKTSATGAVGDPEAATSPEPMDPGRSR